MEQLIFAGAIVTLIGVSGLTYCGFSALRARNAGLDGEELAQKLQTLVGLNMAAFFLSTIGLLIVVVGLIL